MNDASDIAHMKNGRNRTVDTVLYEKRIGEKSYYVIQAVPDTRAKTLYIVTAFIGPRGYNKEAPQLINANSPDVTVKTGSVVASKNSIRTPNGVVNKKLSTRDSYSQEVQQLLEKENAKLKEDVTNLKELLKLQRTVPTVPSSPKPPWRRRTG